MSPTDTILEPILGDNLTVFFHYADIVVLKVPVTLAAEVALANLGEVARAAGILLYTRSIFRRHDGGIQTRP